MPLRKRILKVTFKTNAGEVVLDETIQMIVRIHKDALMVQASCTIECYNLTTNLREQLLSQFTAFNKRQIEQSPNLAGSADFPYVNVSVLAGYTEADGQSKAAVVFEGQVVLATPGAYPPNLSARITCASQQVYKLEWNSGSQNPDQTFKEYVEWVGQKLGVSEVVCETSINDSKTWNQSAQAVTVSTLLISIQDAYKPNISAFIDNNRLIVRDTDKVISSANQIEIDEFIGTPMWTDWGAQFQILLNPLLTLTSLATLKSRMNPSLNNDYVIVSLDYELASRDTPFYMKATGCPPAAD